MRILKVSLLFLIVVFFVSFFALGVVSSAYAADEEVCNDSTLNIVARDGAGGYIANVVVEVYEQITDADNNPALGNKVGSGKTSVSTGFFTLKLKNAEEKKYAIKMNVLGKANTAYVFYNDATLSCGETLTVSEKLSAITFVIRDTEGNLMKNESFSVYAQGYDADNEPIHAKSSLISAFNTGASGAVTAYLPSAIDLNGVGDYVFEKVGKNGGIYLEYDISLSSGVTKELEYILSDMLLTIYDSEGVLFPANSKVEIFEQSENDDGKNVLGVKIKEILTDANGKAVFEYPAGTYCARMMGKDGDFTYFWNLDIDSHDRETYTLYANSAWEPNNGACETEISFSVYTRDISGNLISGLNYSLYKQGMDSDNSPIAKEKIGGGAMDANGSGKIMFKPDPRIKYALQIYDKSSSVGDFWYYNEIQFACGADLSIIKQLPALNIVLRNGDNELVKNRAISIYTQKLDADGKPIKEKASLVSSLLNTGENGSAKIYLAPASDYDADKSGIYVLSVKNGEGNEFNEYGIQVEAEANQTLVYVFSDLVLNYSDMIGGVKSEKTIDVYVQGQNANGEHILGAKIKSLKTDAYGTARLEYPAGSYVAVVKDGLGKNNVFWDIYVKNQMRTSVDIKENVVKTSVVGGMAKTAINVYNMVKDENGLYAKGTKIKSFLTGNDGSATMSLAPAPYLLTFISGTVEYGRALFSENGKLQHVGLSVSDDQKIVSNQKFKLSVPASVMSMAERLQGRILLQVESRGEAWYVDSVSRKRFYMKDGEAAYGMMRRFGLGISNANLSKIPIGLDARFNENDYDADLVSDKMEESIGTDMYDNDSDGDGWNDGFEIGKGYNPAGSGKLDLDPVLASRLRGRILLQVESHGEAWYMNPTDGRRYYLPDGESAYEIMRFLSLGITDADLYRVKEGE